MNTYTKNAILFHYYNSFLITKDFRYKLELINPKIFGCNTNLASSVYFIKILLQKQQKRKS